MDRCDASRVWVRLRRRPYAAGRVFAVSLVSCVPAAAAATRLMEQGHVERLERTSGGAVYCSLLLTTAAVHDGATAAAAVAVLGSRYPVVPLSSYQLFFADTR